MVYFPEPRALIVGEQARTKQEALSGAVIEREHAADAGDDIHDQLGVSPVAVLLKPDIERCTAKAAEVDVGFANVEFPGRIAHWRAAVAAAARLEEHDR